MSLMLLLCTSAWSYPKKGWMLLWTSGSHDMATKCHVNAIASMVWDMLSPPLHTEARAAAVQCGGLEAQLCWKVLPAAGPSDGDPVPA